MSKVFSDDEVSHLSGDEDDEMLSGDEEENAVEKKQEKPDVWEDIYGRKRDKEGNIIKVCTVCFLYFKSFSGIIFFK